MLKQRIITAIILALVVVGKDLVQQVTNQSTDEIESLLLVKEKELMEI